MFRLFVFLVIVLGLGWGFSWLADRPGLISITFEGRLIETSIIVAATAIVALIGAVMLVWWLIQTIWTSPHSVRRYFRARKRDRGYQALSAGLIAAGAGNALVARKMSARARGLLKSNKEPLIKLLEAQTALIEGRHEEAREIFEKMAEDPETRELGLRGLYMEARRLGADEAARHYAATAAESAPYLPWAAQATLEHRSKSGEWDDAIRLLDQQKIANVIDRKQADRLKAVLLTAKATEALESDPRSARESAGAALKLAKDLVPAAIIAAKAWLRDDNLRKAASIMESVWKIQPHPQLAEAYVRARSGDSAADRLMRAERLERLKPNNTESLLTVAQAALDAKEFKKAREKAEAALRMDPRESTYLLLADIEEAETNDQGRIRHWMAQALRAPKDPAWVADGIVSERWLPFSPSSGRLDAFEWKRPFGQLEGPIEEGTLSAETAIANLPPVTPPAAAPEPTPAPILSGKAVSEPVKSRVEAIVVKPAPATDPVVRVETKGNASKSVEPVEGPFNGRLPDDPGVKDPAAAPEPATRLRLF